MNTEDLKPCPFCGATGIDGPRVDWSTLEDGRSIYHVLCRSCHCRTFSSIQAGARVAEQNTIRTWNMRANDTSITMADPGVQTSRIDQVHCPWCGIVQQQYDDIPNSSSRTVLFRCEHCFRTIRVLDDEVIHLVTYARGGG